MKPDPARTASLDERDAQLRRRLLNVARISGQRYEDGYVPFALMLAAKDDEGTPIDDETQAVRLLDELVELRLLVEPELGDLIGGIKPRAAHRRFKLTKKGRSLWMQDIPPITGIADDRLL